jgi:asparagine synthase (glutamine-hydrolysing)
MCGILGWKSPGPIDARIFDGALDLMSHRGPDDRGTWSTSAGDGGAELRFGHRRLSILDLSARGHQPMSFEPAGLTITYNGEVFNFRDVREVLEPKGYSFQSDSDTEVMLAAWREWGPECLHRFNGMFAFGLWDAGRRELHVVRDRLGVKPIYWTQGSFGFAFASEIKSLLRIPGVPRRLNERRLAHYLNFLWVPGPETLFDGIMKLEPGHRLTVRDGKVEIAKWWDVPAAEAERTEAEWIGAVREFMDDSVRLRLISDVPVGAFLSGGVDSSAILAAMRRHTRGDLLAYSVGFRGGDQRYEFAPDDLKYARLVAEQTPGLDYQEIVLEPKVGELLPKMVWHMDEPVADAAAISTYLICQAARERATVMLSGVGAEEIFGGYRRHYAVLLAEKFLRWPGPARRGLKALSDAIPAGAPGPGLSLRRNLHKFAASAGLPFDQRYFGYCGYYDAKELRALVTDRAPTEHVLDEHERWLTEAGARSPLNRLLYVDLKTFLPCLNLTYTDKAAMAASMEVRVPILDYRLVELAATMPPDLKVRGQRQKWVFKEAMRPWVPPEVVKRPKTGFGGPTRSWVKNDLKGMVEDLLSEETLKRRGLLDPKEVRRIIDEDRSGRRDNAYRIWALMTLELWLETFIDPVTF